MNYIFLICAFLFNSLANILLKVGSKQGIILNSYNPFFLIKENIYLVAGLFFFAVNVIFYFLAIKNIPVSVAYPIMVTMSLVIIGTSAVIFFGEQISNYQIIGYSFIILGVILVNFRA